MPLTSDADVDHFCRSEPSPEDLNSLTSPELRLVADRLKVKYDRSASKVQLETLLINHFVGEPIVDAKPDVEISVGNTVPSLRCAEASIPPHNSSGDVKVNPEYLRFQQEIAKINAQLKAQKAEHARQKAEHARLTLEREKLRLSASKSKPAFPQVDELRLIPKFREDDVTKFFRTFEEAAHHCSWPKSTWVTLIRSRIVGKADTAYLSLNDDQCQDYEVVKQAVLNAYRQHPAVHRVNFIAKNKHPDQSYVNHFREKYKLCVQWLRSEEAYDAEAIINLMVLEECKANLPRDVLKYILIKDAKTLEEAGERADEYVQDIQLPEEARSKGLDGRWKSKHHEIPPESATLPVTRKRQGKNSKRDKTCFHCGKVGHKVKDCWARVKESRDYQA